MNRAATKHVRFGAVHCCLANRTASVGAHSRGWFCRSLRSQIIRLGFLSLTVVQWFLSSFLWDLFGVSVARL